MILKYIKNYISRKEVNHRTLSCFESFVCLIKKSIRYKTLRNLFRFFKVSFHSNIILS